MYNFIGAEAGTAPLPDGMSGQQEGVNHVGPTGQHNNHHNKRPVVLIYPTVFILKSRVLWMK
ncbi:hypothetical protein NQ318_013778 [Aromia moschata]|uniref:Uncharacterized protein n=1 Tax=Aromia moschata TaxID=1265417 RepID=A0AAV8Z8C7_9CUCU|nr:hypothetical protein NQ318_013778 [Aromia moschata]